MKISSRNAKGIAGGVVLASTALLAYVGDWEGREHKPYRDIVGVVTYCDGITSPPPIPGKTYTDAECNALSLKNVTAHGEGLLQCVKTRLNQNEYDALTLWTFNVGVRAACNSTLVRKLNAGDRTSVCPQLMRWNRAGGKPVRGLTRRRAFECELFKKPIRPPIVITPTVERGEA